MEQVDSREKTLQEYKKKLQEHADIEAKLKNCKFGWIKNFVLIYLCTIKSNSLIVSLLTRHRRP